MLPCHAYSLHIYMRGRGDGLTVQAFIASTMGISSSKLSQTQPAARLGGVRSTL